MLGNQPGVLLEDTAGRSYDLGGGAVGQPVHLLAPHTDGGPTRIDYQPQTNSDSGARASTTATRRT